MSTPQLSGQDILDDLRIQLGVLSNAFTTDQLLNFINKGTSEVYSVLKSLDLDYFTDVTQTADSTKEDYGLLINPTTREYDLPANSRELRAIECTTSGFETRVFTFKGINDPDFQEARREATAFGPAGNSSTLFVFDEYYYTIFGNQIMFAQYPEDSLTLRIWYVSSIDAVTIDSFPSILYPYSVKIVDYATQRAILASQNLDLAAGWLQEWKESVKTLAISGSSRSSTNAIFITDYLG